MPIMTIICTALKVNEDARGRTPQAGAGVGGASAIDMLSARLSPQPTNVQFVPVWSATRGDVVGDTPGRTVR